MVIAWGSIAIETAALLTSRVKGLIVSEPNFHAGGGMFSRAIAAQTEQHFLAQGYDDMLRAETSPWAGSLQSNAPLGRLARRNKLVEGVKPDWEHLFLSLRCPVMLVLVSDPA